MARKRILVIGGVAGGASCAARARRLSEDVEIILFERGSHVSFANCGLPYYVGDVIKAEGQLLVATADMFKQRFNIDVRLENEVLCIDRDARQVQVRELETGRLYQESYDALVLAPGAVPIRPPFPGIDLPGVFSLRTIPDSREIKVWVLEKNARCAIIVGCGFIGLEMAENLMRLGLSVQMIEMASQVMPPLDPEMSQIIHEHLVTHGIALHLGDGVVAFAQGPAGQIEVHTRSGQKYTADLVILSIGVRPETKLARDAGLELGERGGIRVNDRLQTSDPKIWAVGDAIEVRDFVTGEYVLIPLAGPANRQGRIVADAILGRDVRFRGVQATAVCGVFDRVVAATGANEKTLKRLGWEYGKVYLHPAHHVSYYPGARPISMKMLFDLKHGRILGAQAIGEAGVDRRIDVVAMAIQKGATVYDIEEAELCYAPQFGAAKDPINMAGMVAANALRGDAPLAYWEDLDETDAFLLDVRTEGEFTRDHLKGAHHIYVNELRQRLSELPADREIWAYCHVGQRAYYAVRVLQLNGFRARNLAGGIETYKAVAQAQRRNL